MTQVFDPETGGVTPVTVIEAGPCPVVQVKFADPDGYDAVQLAFDAVADRKLTRPELGHLTKFKVGAHRKLVEFRGGIDGATEGESVTVAIFEPGDKVKVAASASARGSRARSSATTSAPARARTARTTSASRARSEHPRPRRVCARIKMAGRMGGKRVTQLGLTVFQVDRERNLLLVKGAVPGPKNGIVEVRG